MRSSLCYRAGCAGANHLIAIYLEMWFHFSDQTLYHCEMCGMHISCVASNLPIPRIDFIFMVLQLHIYTYILFYLSSAYIDVLWISHILI